MTSSSQRKLQALSALVLVAACSAGNTPGVEDKDGDGVADALGKAVGEFDVDGDGVPDGTGVDTDGDGVADGVGLDTDKDGIIDAIDTDGDGKPDQSVGGSTGGSSGTDDGSGSGGLNVGPGTGGTPIPEDCNPDMLILPLTVRDFDVSHTDMEETFPGDGVRIYLVKPDLGTDKTPILNDDASFGADEKPGMGCSADQPENCMYYPTQKVIDSKMSFDQWYRDVEGVNQTFKKEITLLPDGDGSFVFDSQGTPGFFPLSPAEGFGVSPVGNGKGANYLFTSEIHLEFGYEKGQVFTFRGDDDLWVFVNNKLALDLGGMHNPAEGTIDFDAQAADLGIVPGKNYAMDVFHAERHTDDSNFRIETNIGCFKPVDVVK